MKLGKLILIGLAVAFFLTFVLPIMLTSGISTLFGVATGVLVAAFVFLWGSTIGEQDAQAEATDTIPNTAQTAAG